MSDPRNILAVVRAHTIEQIMALIGRSSPDPIRYRRMLEGNDTDTLCRKLQHINEAFNAPEVLAECHPPTGMGSEFPLSLTDSTPAHAFHIGQPEAIEV